MRSRTTLLLVVTLGSGCFDEVWATGSALFPTTSGTTSDTSLEASSSAGPGTTGELASGGIQTVTGAVASSAPEETASLPGSTAADHTPPVIEVFSVSPPHVDEAGTALLHLSASADAVTIRLRRDDEPAAELTPADFPRPFEVLSEAHDGQHTFEAVAVDADGLESAPASVTLTVDVPASGTEKCLFETDKTDASVSLSMIAGLAYTDEAIVAVGTRDTGSGPRLTLWKLGRDHCEVLPGWPRQGVGGLFNKMSKGTAVALDEHGNLLVAGFALEGITPRRYLAKLNSEGSLLWESFGQLGEEIAGVAVSPTPQAAVFAVGWRRSTADPSPTDAAIWMYKPDGTELPPDFLKAPFTVAEFDPDVDNMYSERLRAVVFEPLSGFALAVGERELKSSDLQVYDRTFLVRMNPVSGREGLPWTSPGAAFNRDTASAVATCGDELVAAGWRRDLVDDAPQPLLQWFERDGTFIEPQPFAITAAQFTSVACDREGKIIGVGFRAPGQLDAFAIAAARSGGLPIWYENGAPGEDEAAAASCDSRGFCASGGYRSEKGKRHAVVRVHHP
ncbi:hypothetical protein [Nannocystis punicea]|uniref:Uncharacterized protein n=1 Tax=Nannocystis punicea TaxID=2995304 RepID=A0ABY7H124_9BACT|nr:hypothetical protein [Nannocystis poenicansa]WAS92953.1 hypothetical protein O0S08_42840 [Nannocystis poenicansa]